MHVEHASVESWYKEMAEGLEPHGSVAAILAADGENGLLEHVDVVIPYSYKTSSLSASSEGVGFEQDCALGMGAIHCESAVACAMAVWEVI